VAAATHKTIRAIRDLITLRVIAPEPAFDWAATAEPSETVAHSGQLETFPVDEQAVVAPRVERPRRIDVHCTVDREKLDQARALLSHCVPSGELGAVIDRALDAVIREVERRKFGATPRPRRVEGTRPTAKARHIPAGVKREVWVRDGARCTFVGRAGHRCGERRFLEFDHVRPAALGGEATTENLRLRCRVHNQHEAERVYGAEFMTEKREVARRGRFEARKTREATRESQADRVRQIASGLRNLGCRADEARSAAEAAVETAPPDAPIEEVLRTALRSLAPPRSTRRDERAPEPLERTEAVAV
jgi:5-methylcytosine-specific restriction endonuclease McrA